VRINEAFGGSANWDLVPEFAIKCLSLITGSPVFGLNALGGALAIEMKNGFNFQGGQAEVSGGSFGRREGVLEYGVKAGNFASYIAARELRHRWCYAPACRAQSRSTDCRECLRHRDRSNRLDADIGAWCG
jgi:hypothetical protein